MRRGGNFWLNVFEWISMLGRSHGELDVMVYYDLLSTSCIENTLLFSKIECSKYKIVLRIGLTLCRNVIFKMEAAKTILTAFFNLCQIDEFARTLLHNEIPKYFVWNTLKHELQRRKQGKLVVLFVVLLVHCWCRFKVQLILIMLVYVLLIHWCGYIRFILTAPNAII